MVFLAFFCFQYQMFSENTDQWCTFVYPHTQIELHGSSVGSLCLSVSFILAWISKRFGRVHRGQTLGEKKLSTTAKPAGLCCMFVYLSSCVWFSSCWKQAYTWHPHPSSVCIFWSLYQTVAVLPHDLFSSWKRYIFGIISGITIVLCIQRHFSDKFRYITPVRKGLWCVSRKCSCASVTTSRLVCAPAWAQKH